MRLAMDGVGDDTDESDTELGRVNAVDGRENERDLQMGSDLGVDAHESTMWNAGGVA